MRSDIRPGGTFPDYSLPDHTNTVRKLSELQGDDPMVLTLARGNYCPKEHQQHLELAANYPKVAVAYTQIVTISTDDHHTTQEFRASVGAQWTFLSDPGSDDPEGPRHPGIHRPRARPDDPPHAGAQAGTGDSQYLQRVLVLGTPVVLRPMARPVRCVERDPPRLGPEQTGATRGLGCTRLLELSRMEQAGSSVDADVV